jgi:hypothetical protein
MGYYAQAYNDENLIKIPFKNIKPVLEALSHTRWNTDTVTEACKAVGFEAEPEEDEIHIYGFNNKYAGVDQFLSVIRPYVTADSVFAFLGEDGALWRWTPEDTQYGTITWA